MSIAYETIERSTTSPSAARTRHRFSLRDYEQMVEFGILEENDRVELIRGEIVDKMTISEPHATCVKKLNHLFCRLLADKVVVGIQDPVVILESRPEPDVALLIHRDDFYLESTPGVDNVLLLIEVADTSLEYDRTEKLSLYAEAGVCEYWIANVKQQCVEVYRDPQPNGTYAKEQVFKTGEMLSIEKLPGIAISVDQVFKPKS